MQESNKGRNILHSITCAVRLLLAEAKRSINRKKKRILPAGIVLIILMISTFSYVRKNGQEQIHPQEKYIAIGISNQDNSEYAALLLSYFKDNEEFSKYAVIAEGEESVLQARFDKGELDCLLVIPEGFAEQMIQMEHLPIRVSVLAEDATKALLLKTVLDAYETYIASVEANCMALYEKMKEQGFSYQERQQANVDVSLDLIFTALGKDSFFARRSIAPKTELSAAASWVCGAGCLLLFLLCFLAGSRLREYFSNGMAWRVRLMGVSYLSLFAAIVLPYVLMMFLMAGCLLLFAAERSAAFFGTEVVLLFPLLLLPPVLGMACKKKQNYLLLYSLSFIGMALLGGSILPELYLPRQFVHVMKWLPNYRLVQLFAEGNETPFMIGAAVAESMVLLLLLLFLMKRRGEEAIHAE